MKIIAMSLLLLCLVVGCSGVPHQPIEVHVTDAETGAPIADAHILAVKRNDNASADQALNYVDIYQMVHHHQTNADLWTTATTNRDGIARFSGPLGSSGMVIEANAKQHFSSDGQSTHDIQVIPADRFVPPTTRPAKCELSLLSGEFGGATIVLTVPVNFRGPILLRESDRLIPHQPGQTVFVMPANLNGVTDLPKSPPRLMRPNIVNPIVAGPAGTPFPHERIPFFYRGRTPTLAAETVGLRAVEFGLMKSPRVAVFFVGTLADVQHYAEDHGIGDWQVHLNETAVRRLFEP